jgi:hypothetical protein
MIKIMIMKKVAFLKSTSATLIILFVALSASILLIACEKDRKEKNENTCPVVAASLVPQVVKDSFAVRYPATNVITWFNKDSEAFCAYFTTTSNIEKLVQFANNGSFIKEEIAIHQEGEQQDTTGTGVKVRVGCECEIHKETD